MKKLHLPTVTLLCVDCVNVDRAINVVEKCKSVCDFGAIKLLTSIPNEYEHSIEIPPLNSLVAYSIFMLTKSFEYIDTSHVLVVQRDGWILNPDSWKDDWLNYDYISPLFIQYDRVGSGGFSLRSKRIMEESAKIIQPWDWTQSTADQIQQQVGVYEDGFLAFNMEERGFKFPPLTEAALFAQGGNPNPAFHREFPFGFHGSIQDVDHTTGKVSPVCEHQRNLQICDCAINHSRYLDELCNKKYIKK